MSEQRLEYELRDRKYKIEDSLVTITGITASYGRLWISALEKAKTVKPTLAEAEKEAEKYAKGLGVESTTVPDIGENVVTNAALAVVKSLLQNRVRADEIKTFGVATESSTDASESMAVQVVDDVRKILKVLKENGVDLGYFDPKAKLHLQDACNSLGDALSDKALNGLEGGKAMFVGTDRAAYKLGTSPDLTGGFGAVAVIVEKSTPETNGIRLSRIVGTYSKETPDFLKIIFGDAVKRAGLEFVATDPIVFGDFSNSAYHYASYQSLKDFSRQSGFKIDEAIAGVVAQQRHIPFDEIPRGFNTLPSERKQRQVVILPHLPYSEIMGKGVEYDVRHLTRVSEAIKDRVGRETNGVKEPLLPGFKNVESELNFLVDLGTLYYNTIGVPKEASIRLRERKEIPDNQTLVENRLNANKDFFIDGMLKGLDGLVKEYNPLEWLLEAVQSVSKNIVSLREKERMTLADVEQAFEPLYFDKRTKRKDEVIREDGVIIKFEKEEGILENGVMTKKDYHKLIKNTGQYKDLEEKLETKKVQKEPRRIGNWYTASEPMGIMSFMVHSDDPSKKDYILPFYGSGLNANTLYGMPTGIETMVARERRNLMIEQSMQREIKAPEYIAIRENTTRIQNEDAPIVRDQIFRGSMVNPEALLKHLSVYLKDYTTAADIKEVVRKEWPVHLASRVQAQVVKAS